MTYSESYEQLIWQNTLQETLSCFVLFLLVLPGSVQTGLEQIYIFYKSLLQSIHSSFQ